MASVQRLVKFKKPLNYGDGLKLQSWIASKVRDEKFPNCIVFCEHTPTFTAGRRLTLGAESSLEADFDRISALGADFYRIPRGGQLTYHGPGQLVGYPILNLKTVRSFKRSVRCYVDGLQKALLHVCRDAYGLPAKLTEDTGVWLGNNKIAAFGIHVTHGITTHGFALNCSTNLSFYDCIVPCGLKGKGATSISKELKRSVTPSMALPKILPQLATAFDSKFEYLSPQHLTELDSMIKAEGLASAELCLD